MIEYLIVYAVILIGVIIRTVWKTWKKGCDVDYSHLSSPPMTEGRVKKGGVNEPPKVPKPDIRPDLHGRRRDVHHLHHFGVGGTDDN